jgi:prophage regulatory protein
MEMTEFIANENEKWRRLNRMYRLRELPQFVGLRRTQIGELIKAGEFPKPVSLSDSGRAVAWLEADLIAWQNARIAARNAGA